MENIKRLINEVEEKRRNWDEYSSFEINGIGNLSQSDLDSIQNYAETYLETGNINRLMEPMGGVGEVLRAYGIRKTSIW